ncbi:hypothetical protein [Leucobacter denitrificans]|uniref:Uncharacterized protein n=1 Tax=Leucobacter denitrificans TaxID=683042 RepID=A0A7G9S7A4_9MICO|nr:hypothetical protein [Leucobacter denitrificans]QNN63729.1 hypothetical protein H9L06_05440 [Leucobacter denitrificans]
MNTALVAIEPVVTAVFGAVGEGLAATLPFLQDLGVWVGENTEVIGVVAAVFGGTIVAAIAAWTASIWAFTFVLLANPVRWINLGIVALVAAIVALVMSWDQVVAFVTEIRDGFISWIEGGLEGFATWWNEIWAAHRKIRVRCPDELDRESD